MKFLSKIKVSFSTQSTPNEPKPKTEPNLDDIHWYAQVEAEIEAGLLRKGLWTKAQADADYDPHRSKANYVKLAVASLKQEAKEAIAGAHGPYGAYGLFNAGKYAEAMEGLIFLADRNNQAIAMVCLGFIYSSGLGGQTVDVPRAMTYAAAAEKSEIPGVRRHLGQLLESRGEWQRALVSYDIAALKGDQNAVALRVDCRARGLAFSANPPTPELSRREGRSRGKPEENSWIL